MAEMSAVVAKLAELSKKGQAPWQGTVDPSAFAANFGHLSVLISVHERPNGFMVLSTYKLAVLDKEGRELDSVSFTEGEDDILYLVSLYDTAKRTALGVDERLDELIQAMDQTART